MSSTTAFAGSVPANYEKYLGPFLFEPYALDLIKRLRKRKIKNVLELAAGTGRVTKHLVNIIPEDGQFIASDLNPDMITTAREKVPDDRIKWQVVDAQDLPFEDNSFDAIVCQYGVMFFPDKPKAYREAYRVLLKDGVYIFSMWNSVDNNPATAAVQNALQNEFGDAAPNFLEVAPYSYYDKNIIKKHVEDAGFTDIKIEEVNINSNYSTPEVVVNGFLHGTPLAGYFNQADEDARNRVKEKATAALVEQFGNSSNEVPLRAFVCEATK